MGACNYYTYFPPGKNPSCKHCNMMMRVDGARYRCAITQYLIPDIEAVPTNCPLEFTEIDDENEKGDKE